MNFGGVLKSTMLLHCLELKLNVRGVPYAPTTCASMLDHHPAYCNRKRETSGETMANPPG